MPVSPFVDSMVGRFVGRIVDMIVGMFVGMFVGLFVAQLRGFRSANSAVSANREHADA